MRLLRQQGEACRVLGSPLYGDLLEAAAADLRDGGPTAAVLDGHLTDRGPSALALRMMGGAHALVLSGQAPDLAAFYPSAGGTADPGPGGRAAWAALRALLAGRAADIRAWLDRPPQTNETGRGAALIGGLCHLVAAAPRPVRLFEIGSSAGLNLRADRFHIPGDAGCYGDPGALVVLPGAWQGVPPPAATVRVTERSGGDLHPIDPATADGRLRLMAYVWPDQEARMARLRSALALAAEVPAELRQETAGAARQAGSGSPPEPGPCCGTRSCGSTWTRASALPLTAAWMSSAPRRTARPGSPTCGWSRPGRAATRSR